MTSPAVVTDLTAPTAVTFSLTQTPDLPDGDPTTGHVVKGATNHGVFICASTDALVTQPSSCAAFANLAAGTPGNGWTCSGDCPAPPMMCPTTPTVGGAGPTLTLPDIGETTTFNVFACKDLMMYSHATGTVSFKPYSHTIAMTGAATDFVAAAPPAGEILAADGAAAKAYVSWDAANLYVGFDKGAAFGNADVVHFYVGGTSGGTQTADTVTATGTAGLPASFGALHHVYWKFSNDTAAMNEWNGTKWVASTAVVTAKFVNGATFVELAVPRAALAALTGVTGRLHLLGGDNAGGAGQVAGTAWPAVGAGANSDAAWHQWQSEALGAAYFPNDTKNIQP
jgi:hypothetical protein